MLSNEAKRLAGIILDKAKEYGYTRLAQEIGVSKDFIYYLHRDDLGRRSKHALKKIAQHIGCMDFYELFELEI